MICGRQGKWYQAHLQSNTGKQIVFYMYAVSLDTAYINETQNTGGETNEIIVDVVLRYADV